MKKFILIFILILLTLVFATLFLYSGLKDLKTKTDNSNPAATELPIETEQEVTTDLGPSVYENYSVTEYDRALSEGRVLVLFFTANWCPICREQEPKNVNVFNSLDKSGVVALKVHVLDSETTEETDALAKKFDVLNQHTFVFLDKNGAVFYKFTGPMEEDELKEKILEVVE